MSVGRERLLLCLVLAVALPMRLVNLTDPFCGDGWRNIEPKFALMARNFAEDGYMTTRLAPSIHQAPPAQPRHLYMHHPPLFPLMVSVGFLAFGATEWAARLVPILASLAGLLIAWAITRRMFGRRAALFAAAVGATIPATAFYGTFVCQFGPVQVAFASGAFLLHLRHLDAPSRGALLGTLACLVFAMGNDWPAYYVTAFIAAHFLVRGRRGAAVAVGSLLLAMPALHLAHVRWATGSLGGGHGGSLRDAFLQRSWWGVDSLGGVGRVLDMIGANLVNLYTGPVLVLAAVGLACVRSATRPLAVAGLLVAGFADILVFPEAAARHDFWNLPLAPALLCLAGGGAVAVADRLPRVSARALAAGAVAIAAFGALESLHDYSRFEEDYHHTLGTVIREHSEPGEVVATCEWRRNALIYYARRRVQAGWRDGLVPEEGLPRTLLPLSKVFVPTVKFRRHRHRRLIELLNASYAHDEVPTERCGNVLVFDVSERLPKR